MRAILAILGLGLVLLGVRPAHAGTVERGAALASRHCGGCHAVGREGKSHEPAAPPFRDLNQRYDPEDLAEALGEGLLVGHPLMPEFRFEPDDVDSMVRYLKSVQTRQSGSRDSDWRPPG